MSAAVAGCGAQPQHPDPNLAPVQPPARAPHDPPANPPPANQPPANHPPANHPPANHPPANHPPPASPEPSKPVATGPREVFPGVRVDIGAKLVEFDAFVPINVKDPETPRVDLEVIACSMDTKEHETLVATRARPSHIHAALLMIGLEPGSPGSWMWDGAALQSIAPKGPPVTVHFAVAGVEHPAADWVISAKTGTRLSQLPQGFVFAGSRITTRNGQDRYDADGAGTIIGLSTFSTETIAWTEVMSHESSVQSPEWIADPARVPAFGTPVVVRIRPR